MRSSLKFALLVLATATASIVATTAALRAERAPQRSENVFFMIVCPHDGYLHESQYTCPDSGSAFRVFKGSDIAEMSLTVKLKTGRNRTITQRLPVGTDAVFLSSHALEDFLATHYDKTGHPDRAAAVRAFKARVESAARQTPAPTRKP